MKYIETPTGEIFNFDDCRIFDSDLCDTEVFFNAENQRELAKELFESTGVLIGEKKGGDNIE